MFVKKFPNSGETTHIRVPTVYKEVIEKLMNIFDKKFSPEQGVHLLHKFINNFEWCEDTSQSVTATISEALKAF